tara:strand:- start:480 stop:893 length:414 start_codon:yes stop_codon:yes gene_type:complete
MNRNSNVQEAPSKYRAVRRDAGAVERGIKSGPALMKWRKDRGITRKLFAEMANCSERTLATCEKADPLPTSMERPVRETVRLIHALQELAGDVKELKGWLEKPNPAFRKMTPLALIKNGESDLLWEMVYQLRLGAFA